LRPAAAGVNITHVPFKGAGAAISDLLGGHIDITYATPGSIAAHVHEPGCDPTFIGLPASRDYVFAEMRKWRKVMQVSNV
jgi:hypothetical protein